MNAIIEWCGSNKASARLTRTIFQALISFLTGYMADIIGLLELTPEMASLMMAAGMAILSPIQAWIGEMKKKGGDADA